MPTPGALHGSLNATPRAVSESRTERDGAGRLQAADVILGVADLPQDLGGVLPEERSGAADRGGGQRRAGGEGQRVHRTQPRLVDLRHEPQVSDLRVFKDLVELVD